MCLCHLHKARLQSELIQGEVVMGVQQALPIEGVYIIDIC